MQFLYYKNKIINLINGSLPKSVFAWYVILGACVTVSIIATSLLYFNVYKVYTGQTIQTNDKDKYEPVLDFDGLDEIVDFVKNNLRE